MSDLRLLLDENIGHDLFNALTRHWPEMDVWTVGDPGAPRRKTPDPEILIWCEAKQFALVTYDRASMPTHLRDHLATDRHILASSCCAVGCPSAKSSKRWAPFG